MEKYPISMNEARMYQIAVKRKMNSRFSPTAINSTDFLYLRNRDVLIWNLLLTIPWDANPKRNICSGIIRNFRMW